MIHAILLGLFFWSSFKYMAALTEGSPDLKNLVVTAVDATGAEMVHVPLGSGGFRETLNFECNPGSDSETYLPLQYWKPSTGADGTAYMQYQLHQETQDYLPCGTGSHDDESRLRISGR